ncbi:MAG: hypothetical protein KBB64_01845 [Bacteroidia bacterium]|nr:hypothetical protein [Bacteroidia bacterium]
MRTTTSFLIQLVIFCLPLCLKASDKIVYDAINNKELAIQSRYKTVEAVQINFYEETDVNYFLLEKANTSAEKNLQEKLESLALNSWNSELSLLKLYSEAKKRIAILQELEYSSQRRYDYDQDPSNVEPRLKEVEMQPICLVNDQLWLRINYQFIRESSNNNTFKIDITHYYIASLSSGSLEKFTLPVNKSTHLKVANLLSPYFTSQYLYATDKLNSASDSRKSEYEEDEEEVEYFGSNSSEKKEWRITSNDSAVICRQLCERLHFEELNFYWNGWTAVACFQPYSASSRIYNGDAFSILLPDQIVDSLRKIIPEFPYYNNKSQIQTSIKDFNYYKIIEPISAVSYAPSLEKLISSQNDKKIHKVRIESYQLFKNNEKTFRGNFLLEYNEKGQLIRKTFFETNNTVHSDESYSYDSKGRKISVNGQGYRKQAIHKKYKYNTSGNLLSSLEMGDDNVYIAYFFYNKDNIYMIEQDENNFRDEGIKKLSFRNNELRFANTGYQLNEKKEPVFITGSKYRYEDLHIGRDSLGRIIESHRENDRYNQYFTYDQLSRFTLFQSYDYQRQISKVEYFYKDSNPLPYQQIKITNQHETVESEVYTYEFY